MAEAARGTSASEISGNIGDVLASIRRLIAQDEANRAHSDPTERLRQAAIAAAEARRAAPITSPPPPLILKDSELIAETRTVPRQATVTMPRMRPDLDHRQTEGGPIFLDRNAGLLKPVAVEAPAVVEDMAAPLPEPESAPESPLISAAASLAATIAETVPTAPANITSTPKAKAEAAAPVVSAAPDAAAITPKATPSDDQNDHLFTIHNEETPAEMLLRGLIREAIRAELQGELGGQFSRNLRRVIRSEIDIALRQSRKAH